MHTFIFKVILIVPDEVHTVVLDEDFCYGDQTHFAVNVLILGVNMEIDDV